MAENGRGVSEDDDAGTLDDTRDGLQQEPRPTREGVAEAPEQGCEIEQARRSGDEQAEQLDAKVKRFLDSLTDEEREVLSNDHTDELVATVMNSWSGILPDPVSFSQYPEYAQRQMVAWNDARIIDESKRLDRIADAAISQAKKGQWLSFALNVVFASLSFVSFLVTGSVAAFGFLAIPGISVAFNIYKDHKRDKDNDGE